MTNDNGPLAAYRQRVAAGELSADSAQAEAAARLDGLSHALSASKPVGLFKGLRRKGRAPEIRGLYLWGPVGRGKTMLMDLFFDLTPVPLKRRVHFAAFMIEVHARLHRLRSEGHGGDAVEMLAAQIAADVKLLCFDEFQITDIADAMVLGRLFTALFAQGVVMVATSNTAPENLYAGGLQRALFLPFIGLLREKVDVVRVAGPDDHRLGRLVGRKVYLSPADDMAEAELARLFADLTVGSTPGSVTIPLAGGRHLDVRRAGPRVAWFDAPELVGAALGAAEFLALADAFDTLIISRIPRLSAEQRNETRRLITLVDVLYDAGTRLIASAEAAPTLLCVEGLHAVEFERTASRLLEMQSESWVQGERRGEAADTLKTAAG